MRFRGTLVAALSLAACAAAPSGDGDSDAFGEVSGDATGDPVAEPQRPPLPVLGAKAPSSSPGVLPARPPLPPDPAPQPPADGARGPSVAGPRGELLRVGSRVLTTADLGDFLLRWQPESALPALRRLTSVALVEAEAAREGADVPPADVEAAASAALDARVRRIRLEHGAAADPDQVLRTAYGRTLEGLRADLRRAVRADLLRERLARLASLRRDGVELRILVVPDERAAQAAAAQWREGADGGLLARRLGLRAPTAPPAVALDDVPDVDLRARFAAAEAGTVLPPVPFEADDPEVVGSVRTWWQVFRVVRTWKGSAAPWSEIGPRVEASLRESPSSPEETDAWEARVARRTGVAPWDPTKGFGPSPPPGTMPLR